ncbi:hypothetical protein [Desulfovibrio sp. UCD-KL4C]|uniref:hypothetical protein n=1 Tax=Desulfovibrio sp. UCD-KL4C TaxID=2578120 RepID=UPI0025BF91B5|nr:hypothetical protein [Desulfovibrio sp. UCD-KL4C]
MNMVAQKQLDLFITELFGNGEILDVKGIYELVITGYQNAKDCSMSCINERLEELKDTGILLDEGSYFDDSGEQVSLYRISECGLDKLYNFLNRIQA